MGKNKSTFFFKKKKLKGQKFSTEEQILFLRRLNKREKLALFLGAGVSKECGLPDWSGLLEHLRKKLPIDYQGDIADSARNLFGSKFNKEVSDCLYSNEITISPALKAIAKSGIKKIVCFNFDDLLEESLSTEIIEHRVVLNGENFDGTYPNVLVFHPHGYLERFIRNDMYESSKIILSESDYNELYKNHYCLTNLIQLSILMSHTVLFVGMSLTDPNTMRLLETCRKLGVRHWHYALFKCPEKKEVKSKTIEFRSLGVDPIWLPDYSIISEVFKRLRVGSREKSKLF